MIFDFLFKKKDDIIKDPIRVESSSAQQQSAASGSMRIEDVFSIRGRGTVATGKVYGTIHLNDTALITTNDGRRIKAKIKGIEAFRKSLDVAMDGDNCGLLLEGVARNDIERGDKIEVI